MLFLKVETHTLQGRTGALVRDITPREIERTFEITMQPKPNFAKLINRSKSASPRRYKPKGGYHSQSMSPGRHVQRSSSSPKQERPRSPKIHIEVPQRRPSTPNSRHQVKTSKSDKITKRNTLQNSSPGWMSDKSRVPRISPTPDRSFDIELTSPSKSPIQTRISSTRSGLGRVTPVSVRSRIPSGRITKVEVQTDTPGSIPPKVDISDPYTPDAAYRYRNRINSATFTTNVTQPNDSRCVGERVTNPVTLRYDRSVNAPKHGAAPVQTGYIEKVQKKTSFRI